MLDAKTYQADYVSPNAEKLLGITVEQICKDIRVLGKLHPAEHEDPEKNYLEEILKEYGFLVDTAENGAEAVEKVKHSKPGNP